MSNLTGLVSINSTSCEGSGQWISYAMENLKKVSINSTSCEGSGITTASMIQQDPRVSINSTSCEGSGWLMRYAIASNDDPFPLIPLPVKEAA